MASDDAPPDYEPTRSPDPSEPALPPNYSSLDPSPTSFSIDGSIIHTPSGPHYQLSSELTQSSFRISMRRVAESEARRYRRNHGAEPLHFSETSELWTLTHSMMSGALLIEGRRRHTLPGTITLRRGLLHWSARHYPKKLSDEGRALYASRIKRKSNDRRNSAAKEEVVAWKNADDEVVAHQVTSTGPEPGARPVQSLELTGRLDELQRNTLVVCWVGRLWQETTGMVDSSVLFKRLDHTE